MHSDLGKVANETKTETNPNISMSFNDIAEELNLTVKEVKDAYESAIRKIKHPIVGNKFKKYVNIGSTSEENL